MTIAIDFDGTIVEHRYPNFCKLRLFVFCEEEGVCGGVLEKA